ncbi:MAG TPA: hypothetical protein VIY08_14720 [Candidatus Nitrosocosmicus sp.]
MGSPNSTTCFCSALGNACAISQCRRSRRQAICPSPSERSNSYVRKQRVYGLGKQ